jgi:hypothetical protein
MTIEVFVMRNLVLAPTPIGKHPKDEENHVASQIKW